MDDVYAQKALTEYARHAGYLSSGVSDPRKAAATIAQNPTHLIIVDCDKNTTRDFVDAVRKHKPHLIVVGFVDNLPGVEQQAEDGINGYLVRPLSQDAVTYQLNELLLKEAETGPPPKVVVIDDDADAVTAVARAPGSRIRSKRIPGPRRRHRVHGRESTRRDHPRCPDAQHHRVRNRVRSTADNPEEPHHRQHPRPHLHLRPLT